MEHATFLPIQLDSCYDLILRVFGRIVTEDEGKGPNQLVAFGRLTVEDLLKKSGEPEWIPLQKTSKSSQSNPIFMLAGFTLQKSLDIRVSEHDQLDRTEHISTIIFSVIFFRLDQKY